MHWVPEQHRRRTFDWIPWDGRAVIVRLAMLGGVAAISYLLLAAMLGSGISRALTRSRRATGRLEVISTPGPERYDGDGSYAPGVVVREAGHDYVTLGGGAWVPVR